MKKINFIFGTLAVVLAMGAAYASTLTANDYVSIRLKDEAQFQCVQAVDCDNIGPNLCKVTVVGTLGALPNAQVFDLNTAPTCVNAKFNNAEIPSQISIQLPIVEVRTN